MKKFTLDNIFKVSVIILTLIMIMNTLFAYWYIPSIAATKQDLEQWKTWVTNENNSLREWVTATVNAK